MMLAKVYTIPGYRLRLVLAAQGEPRATGWRAAWRRIADAWRGL